jgi:hypothetical protein
VNSRSGCKSSTLDHSVRRLAVNEMKACECPSAEGNSQSLESGQSVPDQRGISYQAREVGGYYDTVAGR